jgi:DNA-binding transcriptional MerR regulator
MAKSLEAFRTIGEVSEWLDTPPHVLRFWESRFPQLKPVKRAGGRRYYRPGDIALLGGIKQLLHDDGVTIRGVQKILQEKGIGHVAGLGSPASAAPDAPPQPLPPEPPPPPAATDPQIESETETETAGHRAAPAAKGDADADARLAALRRALTRLRSLRDRMAAGQAPE